MSTTQAVIVPVEPFHVCARDVCTTQMKPGSGFVPGLETLYRKARKSKVDKGNPLQRFQIVAQELCGRCAKLAAFDVIPTRKTLGLMERWTNENAQRASLNDSRRVLRLMQVTEELDKKSGVNRAFVQAGTKKDGPRPQYRQRRKHPSARPKDGKTKSQRKRGKKGEQGGKKKGR